MMIRKISKISILILILGYDVMYNTCINVLLDALYNTWLYLKYTFSSDGMYKEDVIVPDSITNWEMTAFGFNNDHGLSVSDKKEVYTDIAE
jgi:hypothetical protein